MWNPNSIIFCFTLFFQYLLYGEFLRLGFINHEPRRFIHLKLLYIYSHFISLIYLFLSGFNLYAAWIGYYSIHQGIFIFFLSGVLIYARFIEPHLVRVDTHQYRLNPDRSFDKPVKLP